MSGLKDDGMQPEQRYQQRLSDECICRHAVRVKKIKFRIKNLRAYIKLQNDLIHVAEHRAFVSHHETTALKAL